MKIYLLKQSRYRDYDTFDSFVAVAESEADARTINPYDNDPDHNESDVFKSWPADYERDIIEVTEIGIAYPGMKRGPVCSSYNAG